MTYRKKLVEVALPLVEINDASAYDKMPGIGPHPKSIHKWWAPLPLPSARAVLFASLVDDPEADPKFANQPEEIQDQERERLFGIIQSLLQKKIHEHPEVFEAARAEIERSCDGNVPAMLDPFAGSGAIPIEGQRLGLRVYASDLNPIPVMINKVLIEILPQFADHPPVNPEYKKGTAKGTDWQNAKGLAADLRYYSRWILEQAREKIGKYYPTAPNGEQVIGWLWARTVKCPNPACGATMPLISTYNLSTKKNSRAWLEPIVDRERKTVTFNVATGKGKPETPPKVGRGAKFRCLVCGEIAPDKHIKDEALAGRMGSQLTAIIADGGHGRIYYPPNELHEATALQAKPEWLPQGELADDPRNIWCKGYGLTDVADLFTQRQLLALGHFADLIPTVNSRVMEDSDGDVAYTKALITLLAFVLDRCADFNNALCRWKPSGEQIIQLFSRQAIPMVWDYVEANIIGQQAISWYTASHIVADVVEVANLPNTLPGTVQQMDAAKSHYPEQLLISTDPPYYDNISYAGLSDVFYVWLRRSLRDIYPEIFGTMLVPKSQELIADPERFGGQEAAREHFETGFQSVFTSLYEQIDPRFPMTVYYAFKQSDAEDETDEDNNSSNAAMIDLTTGWETLLSGLISSGFQITATWPVRASQAWRLRSMGANALASYIILACRPRPVDAPTISRRGFMDELKRGLPPALHKMQSGNIAPVDLAQASIGPGMAIYSRYSKVLEANGSPMSVRTALGLINQELDAYLAEQDGDIDSDTRFAVAWFTEYGFETGEYGRAETLATAKNVSVSGVERAGIVQSGRGKVRLLHWKEYDPGSWDPQQDKRPTVWEATHHLIERLNNHGETGSAMLMTKIPHDMAAEARNLAYRLYSICERKGWADHARDYNALVISWAGIGEETARLREAVESGQATRQMGLFGEE